MVKVKWEKDIEFCHECPHNTGEKTPGTDIEVDRLCTLVVEKEREHIFEQADDGCGIPVLREIIPVKYRKVGGNIIWEHHEPKIPDWCPLKTS